MKSKNYHKISRRLQEMVRDGAAGLAKEKLSGQVPESDLLNLKFPNLPEADQLLYSAYRTGRDL